MITNYLIDPYALQRFLIEHIPFNPFGTIDRKKGLDGIYRALSTDLPEGTKKVNMVEVVYSPHVAARDCIYVDEEGRMFGFEDDHAWFCVAGHPSPISGRGLVCGTDDEGEDIAPKEIDLDWLRNNIRIGWKDYEAGFDGDRMQLTQSPGVHVLDRWAYEGRIPKQSPMESMGLATYGTFYREQEKGR